MLTNIYHYELDNWHASSEKYGKCEVCGKHCAEVYGQTESREYIRRDGTTGRTYHTCRDLHGHKECLIKARKNK